jgi:hypothetical protein
MNGREIKAYEFSSPEMIEASAPSESKSATIFIEPPFIAYCPNYYQL